MNYGIFKVERLDGDIGYIDLRAVAPPDDAARAIAAAMELVSGTAALIIDLRHNGGGAPAGVVFWLSYLFPDDQTHLNDIFDAGSGETRQFWTLASVPGHRYLDRPVYLLTSERTFSGGEDFAYSLQAQGRAELIGETTGGGAHPTQRVPISATLVLAVPNARSVNPVTGTNWEGTGVVPDVAVPAEQAFDVAYGRALRHVLTLHLPPPLLDEAREALAALEALAYAYDPRHPDGVRGPGSRRDGYCSWEPRALRARVRPRSLASRMTLRRRTADGVTSTHSSSATELQRLLQAEQPRRDQPLELVGRWTGGCWSASSPWSMLTSISSAREFSPTIMPS